MLQQTGVKWVSQNLVPFLAGFGDARREMQETDRVAGSSSLGLAALSGAVMGVASSIATYFIDSVVKATKAVAGFAWESAQLAGTFQSMESRLRIAAGTIGNEVANEVGGVGEIALRVGGDVRLMGVSATQAAEAMTDLLKAGIPLQDVLGDVNGYMEEGGQLGGVLRGAIDLATASELDMVGASKFASTMLNQFGLDADEVSGYLDYVVRELHPGTP